MNPLLRSIQAELREIVYHPRYLLLLTAGLVFSYLFFITFMNEGQPQKLPIAIVDQDGSYLSRRLCHEIAATQGVKVVAVYNNHQQARDAMQRQRIFAFLEIPKGTYNDLLGFKRPHVALYANNAYLLGGSFSYKSLATMTKLASGAVQREILRKKGYSDKMISGLIQPIELDTHCISNPMVNYQPYVLTTMLPGIIGVMMLLLTIFQIQQWLAHDPYELMRLCHGSLAAALFGKMLPYTLWFTLMGVVGNLVFFGFCNYTLLGSFWMLALTMLLFVLAVQAMGLLLVGLIPDLHMSISVGAIYGMLAFTMSGFSYPVTNMPIAMQAFSALFPLRYYYLTYADIALFGSGIRQYLPHIASLLVFLIPGFVGILLISRQLRMQGVWQRLEQVFVSQSADTTPSCS